jgi:hypothetical protein
LETPSSALYREAFMAHLQKLGFTDLTVLPNPIQIATEAHSVAVGRGLLLAPRTDPGERC